MRKLHGQAFCARTCTQALWISSRHVAKILVTLGTEQLGSRERRGHGQGQGPMAGLDGYQLGHC